MIVLGLSADFTMLDDGVGALLGAAGTACAPRPDAGRHGGARYVGEPFENLFLPEDRAAIGSFLRPVLQRDSLSAGAKSIDDAPLRVHARDALGRIRALDVHRLADHGRPTRAGRVAAPQTTNLLLIDRTADAAELARYKKAADKAQAEAQMTAARLADLSHEMKTPLTAVIGFAEAIETETFGPINHEKYPAYAGHIKSAGGHLLDLVTSLLDMARLDADRLSLRFVQTAPGRLAEECAAMVSGAARDAGLNLVVNAPIHTPACMLDPRAVRQILLNLLSNAVKFTSDGEVHLSVQESDGEIAFIVRDTGIGMNAQDLEKLGPRFTDAQGAGVRGADGAGIGLSLAIRLARLHGGDIDFQSAPGEGLRATVRLPIDGRAKGLVEDLVHGDDAIGGSVVGSGGVDALDDASVLTQLERVEMYRRETADRRTNRGVRAA